MGAPKKTDLSRAERKSKKRQLEDTIPDLPGDEQATKHDGGENTAEQSSSKKRKRDGEGEGKTEKKRAKAEGIVDADEEENADPDAPRKSKKERKAERKAKDAAEAAARAVQEESEVVIEKESKEKTDREVVKDGEPKVKKNNNRNRDKKRREKAAAAAGGESKAPRFIVFVGNLPYSATTQSVTAHFAKMKPTSVRHITEKDKSKSKGIAFIEFEGYDHMKSCLQLFHHSLFDDKISPPRKINCELTVGGGGNSKERKTKLGEKNKRLNEQRARKAEVDAKSKKEKAGGNDDSGVHPSRRAHIPSV